MWKIYKKEMIDSLRDRRTLLLSLIIPLLMMGGLALFYEIVLLGEPEVEIVSIAVDEKMDPRFREHLSQIPDVKIIETPEPIHMAHRGEVRVAIMVDEGFMSKIEREDGSASIRLYTDETSIKNSLALDYLYGQLGGYREEIIEGRLEALGLKRDLIQPFQIKVEPISELMLNGSELNPQAETNHNSSSTMLLGMLLPMMIVMTVMVGSLPSAIELFAGEKERKTMEALLITPVNRTKLLIGKWLAISTLGFISGLVSLIVFSLIVKLFTVHLAEALNIDQNIGAILFAANIGIIAFALLYGALQMIVSLISNSYKEAQSYISPLMMIGFVPYILMIGLSPRELTLTHFAIPIMNVYALLKELLYGIVSFQHLAIVFLSSLVTIGLAFAVARWMFRKDRWVLGK